MANPPAWAEPRKVDPASPIPNRGEPRGAQQIVHTFLGRQHHTRAQQQPHPTLTLWNQRGSALGEQNKSILASPADATMCHWHWHGVTPLSSSPCPQAGQHAVAVPVSPHAHTQTRRESGFNSIFGDQQLLLPRSLVGPDLLPGPSMAQHHHPPPAAFPHTQLLLVRMPGALGRTARLVHAPAPGHCNWGEAGAPWGCLSSS